MEWNSAYGNFTTRTFADIYPEEDEWLDIISESPLGSQIVAMGVTSQYQKIAYYLLYAKYGNSHIASFDENQYKFKMLSVLMSYGPAWVKEMDIQKQLVNLSADELIQGSQHINNHSYNPSSAPSTELMEALPTVDDQYNDKWKKSKMDGYQQLMALLKKDVNEEFISHFAKCFITITNPTKPLWYVSEEDE